MDNLITIDLFAPQDFSLDALAMEGIPNFLSLQKEVTRLITGYVALPQDGIFFLDKWTETLFLKVPLDKINSYRQLLRCLFGAFLSSKTFKRICKRFGWEASEMLEQVDENAMLYWLTFWSARNFPTASELMFEKEDLKRFSFLNAMAFKQIIQYLPKFMLWHFGSIIKSKKGQSIILTLANGHNIRAESKFPLPFSKKMAHYFVNAPHHFELNKAIWYGAVKGLGGYMGLINAFNTVFVNGFPEITFLKKVVRFFVNNEPVRSHGRLCRLLGYIRHLNDENLHFSLKGWTIKSCQRRSDEWYRLMETPWQTRTNYSLLAKTWTGAPYQPFIELSEQAEYQIIQLTSYSELVEESSRMSHCVRTYANKCAQGYSSIWSLRKMERNKTLSLATIEVQKGGNIVQVKAKCNATPGRENVKLIRQWASQEGLIWLIR